MSHRHATLAIGVWLGLSACALSPGQDPPPEPGDGERRAWAPTYGVQQVSPRPLRTPPPSRFDYPYRLTIEQDLVDRANRGQRRAGRPRLFVASRLSSVAREQSVRMAARGEAGITPEDLQAMKNVVSPSSLPPRDWWIFVNKVTGANESNAGYAIVMSGPRPWLSYNFYALKPNFNALGVGVYRSGDSHYATLIVTDHEAR